MATTRARTNSQDNHLAQRVGRSCPSFGLMEEDEDFSSYLFEGFDRYSVAQQNPHQGPQQPE